MKTDISLKRVTHVIKYSLIILIPLVFSSCAPAAGRFAEKGELKLDSWDFQEKGVVLLDGEWEFYLNQYLESSDFTPGKKPHVPLYVKVPALWSTYTDNGNPVPAAGYATYRLSVTLPDKGMLYGLKITDTSTAYSLFVDGKRLGGNGKTGTGKQDTIPRWMPQTFVFAPQSEHAEIIFHIANFHYDKAGFWKSIYFGPAGLIDSLDIRTKALAYFLTGIVFAIGVYHLFLFFLGKRDKATLFFGIFCLIFIIRSAFTGERIAISLLPFISWHAGLLFEFLSIYLDVVCFLFFLKALFPDETYKTVHWVMSGITSVSGLLIILLPADVINSVHSIYLIILLLCCVYVIVVLVLASLRKRVGALFLLVGFLFFFLTIFYDSIAAIYIINTDFLAPIGILFFIFTEFGLYIKFIKAEDELHEREKELIQAEKLASLGTLVAGVAHEINNPNGSIFLTANTLSSAWNNLKEKLDENLEKEGDFPVGKSTYGIMAGEIGDSFSRILKNSNRISAIVKDLKDYARKDESGLDQEVIINDAVKGSLRLLENLIRKSAHHLDCALSDNLPLVKGNMQRLEQVLINIIQNACQALDDAEKGISIATRFDDKTKQVIVTVHDQGIGMDRQTLKRIYDPFFTTRRTQGGTGLGLAITSRIIKDHGGKLVITSKPGKGTTVIILLPIAGSAGKA